MTHPKAITRACGKAVEMARRPWVAVESWIASQSPSGEDLSKELEEAPLLAAIT
jgi:hypothetical protein